jgi:hypothetical protein
LAHKVLDTTGQALAYIYARETEPQADVAKVLTFDEAQTGYFIPPKR